MIRNAAVGSTKYRKGLKLYGLDGETGRVYLVEIEENTGLDSSAPITPEGNINKAGKYKAEVNPDHKLLWALNKNNALRKFANDPVNLKILAKNKDDD